MFALKLKTGGMHDDEEKKGKSKNKRIRNERLKSKCVYLKEYEQYRNDLLCINDFKTLNKLPFFS